MAGIRLKVRNVGYYKQFMPLAITHLTTAREPIQKSLEELVKLSKWDLRNYDPV